MIDTTKAARILFTHGGTVRDYEGVMLLPRENDGFGKPLPLTPMARFPPRRERGRRQALPPWLGPERIKIEIIDPALYPDLAILDPEATATLPPAIAAATGMDALTHAIEGLVSTEWSPHADAFALQAIRMIRENLERAVADTSDVEARGNMLVAANLAIQPTSSNAIGIAHSMSHPCGAHFGVPHGVANSINLPWVIEWNAAGGEEIADRYRQVADLLGVDAGGGGQAVGTALAGHVRDSPRDLPAVAPFGGRKMPEDGIPALVEGAMGDGCTLVNPREPTEEDFAELFRRAL